MNQPPRLVGGINVFKYAAPHTFYPLAGKMIPWFSWLAAVLCVAGLYIGFFVAPTDHQQGDSYNWRGENLDPGSGVK